MTDIRNIKSEKLVTYATVLKKKLKDLTEEDKEKKLKNELEDNDNDENNRNEEEFFYKNSGIKNNEDLLKTIPLGYLKIYNNDPCQKNNKEEIWDIRIYTGIIVNQNVIDLTKINNYKQKDIKIEDSLTSELNSDKYKIK
ncbi:hypothetical protein H8356DRAFT_1342264 [Neocallimastix lanati (nom. inval.)]|nr:hypothetical protein H8356DRAFT_1342264 [Neocallimastix sp. JGI-2020a]